MQGIKAFTSLVDEVKARVSLKVDLATGIFLNIFCYKIDKIANKLI